LIKGSNYSKKLMNVVSGTKPQYIMNFIEFLSHANWHQSLVDKIEMLLSPTSRIKYELIAKTKKLLYYIRQFDRFDMAILVLTLVIFSMRLAIVNFPSPEAGEKYSETGFVFDETYYIKAARKMLVGEASNNEHPPLAKAFFMLGIILFGDNPLGWRIFPIIASSISLVLVYGIAFLLCGKKSASFFASLLFATDIMAFNIGQIAILDALSILFVLAGSILLLKEKNDFGGIFLGLASLCKLSTIFASAGVVFFLVLSNSVNRKKDLKFLKDQTAFIVRIFLIGFVIFLFGLWIYDFAYKVFNNNPLEHLIYMYNYHNSLRYQNPEEVILPLEWINPLKPFNPVSYYVISVREILNSGIALEYHPIAYYGIYTPLWWSIWALVPISLIEAVRKARRIKEQGIDLFSFVWIIANFFPYVLLGYLMQRWVYPFYFYMSLPGLYISLPYYSISPRPSKVYLALLIGVQLVWFIILFPVRLKVVIDFLLSLGLPA
jgi:dolichyl-phosphate-mannose-protein mannosyltransferase